MWALALALGAAEVDRVRAVMMAIEIEMTIIKFAYVCFMMGSCCFLKKKWCLFGRDSREEDKRREGSEGCKFLSEGRGRMENGTDMFRCIYLKRWKSPEMSRITRGCG